MVADATDSNGRRPDGRFAPGNQASKGTRQSHRQKLLRAFSEAITVDDVIEIAASLLEKAKSGDAAAAKLLTDRLWGRVGEAIPEPPEDTEPPRVDMFAGLSGEALEQARERERAIRRSRMSLEEQKSELLAEIEQWESKRHG